MDNAFYELQVLLFPATETKRILLHFLFWITFVLFHLMFFIPFSFKGGITMDMVYHYALYYARFAPIFYLILVIIRMFLRSKSGPYLWVSLIIVSILVTQLMTVIMFETSARLWGHQSASKAFQRMAAEYLSPDENLLAKAFSNVIYDLQDMQLLILPIGIKMIKFGIMHERARKEAETQQLKAELSQLRSQLSPHFLFNIINLAYAELLPISRKAADYLANIAGILRFRLYDTSNDLVPLEKEMVYLRQLVTLESDRASSHARISLSIAGKIEPRHQIPALILISLAENAFKHGQHGNFSDSRIVISAALYDEIFKFHITNTKPVKSVAQIPVEGSSGIGLKNISKQLSIHFPGAHTFNIVDSDHYFTAELVINFRGASAIITT